MTEPNLLDIFKKVAARNPAVPASASEQKGGLVNRHAAPGGSYFEGSSAGKQGIGDVDRHSSPGSGYVNLNGPQNPGQQGIGLVNRHASPDGGERGNLGGDGMTVTKDAADKTKVAPGAGKNGTHKDRPHLTRQGVANANTTTKAAMAGGDKTMVSQRAPDSRKGGRAWLTNQGVARVNTMTKDATWEERGMMSAFNDLAKIAEEEKAAEEEKLAKDEKEHKARDIAAGVLAGSPGIELARGKGAKGAVRGLGRDVVGVAKGTLKGGLIGGSAGAALGALAGAAKGGKRGAGKGAAIGGAVGGYLGGSVGSTVGGIKAVKKTYDKDKGK